MRALTILAALTIAAPAAAQDTWALTVQRDAELQAQADAARRREVELNNRLSTLESRLQGEQALGDLAAQRQRPVIAPFNPKGPPAVTPKYASIPDDRLAASNAAVRAAAANRR